MGEPYFNSRLIIDTVDEVLRHYGLDNIKDKKVRTNGGEYYGPCPHCKKTGVDPTGGKDRLLLWFNRPVVGGAPCFYCRDCGGDGRFSAKWTGDLPHFLMDTMYMSFIEALDYLEIPEEYRKDLGTPKSFAPRNRIAVQKSPALEWRKAGMEIVEVCEANLWSSRGVRRLEQLMSERLLSEKTIKFARIGFNPKEYWMDGSKWGLDGRIKIPRGYVIPEFQWNYKSKELELWSIAIRRLDQDLDNEFLETGKEPNRYHAITGSVRGLYMAHTLYAEINTPKIVVLVEGQFDALAALEATNFEFLAVAAQTVRGAQYPQWVTLLLDQAAMVLIAPDTSPDGKDLLAYWSEQLGDKAHYCKIKGYKDLSEMHSNGNDVGAWLRSEAQRFYTFSRLRYARQDEAERVQIEVAATVTSPESQDRVTAILEPVMTIPAQSEEVKTTEKCVKCGEQYEYEDTFDNKWCKKDFACFQLMNLGAEYSFKEIEYPAGYGLVDPKLVQFGSILSDNPGPGFVYVEGGRVPPTRIGYKKFCLQADPADIWLAARECYGYIHGLIPRQEGKQKTIIQHPCANTFCHYDRKKPHYPEGEPYKDRYGNVHWPGNGKPGAVYYEVTTWPGTPDELRWCPRCTMCHRFLLLNEQLGYPGLGTYVSNTLLPGKEAAIAYAREQSLFSVMYVYAILEEKHGVSLDRLLQKVN